MNTTDLNWKNWLLQADQYLKAGTSEKAKIRFGTDIRYNLLSLSLESYIMAILDYKGTMPENHTYTDLLNALESVITIQASLKEQILKYENIQQICSIDKYSIKNPTEEELADLHNAISNIGEIAYSVINDAY